MKKASTGELSPAQQRVLRFVEEYVARQGVPPTVREVSEALGFASSNAAALHLANLCKKGFLVHRPGVARGYLPRNPKLIPILGRIAAGRPILAEENLEGYLEADPFLARGTPEAMFVLKVEGDSMIGDGIFAGDYLFVRRQSTAQRGDIVVALLEDEATVKRFEPLPSGAVKLIPSNPAYKAIEVDPADGRRFEILGVVVGLYRRI